MLTSFPRFDLRLVTLTLSMVCCACSGGKGNTSGTTSRASATNGTASGSGSTGTGSGGSASAGLGGSCSKTVACQSDLECVPVPELKESLCTVSCSASTTCPDNGTCVTPLPGQTYCLPLCASNADCGADICDPSCKVCIPLLAAGQVSCAGHVVGGGGTLDGGGPCGALPSSGGLLGWSPAVDVSAGQLTIAEAEGDLSSDGQGHLIAAFMVLPDAGPDAGEFPPENTLGIAVSSDDGATFGAPTLITSYTDSQLYDPTLAYADGGVTYLAYGGLVSSDTPPTFGSGEVYVAISKNNGATWSSPVNAFATIAPPVDKPFLAVNPATQLPVVVFADLENGFGGTSRIQMVTGHAGGTFSAATFLDDGTLAAAVDLPTVAFDNSGNAYAAWAADEERLADALIDDQATGTELVGAKLGGIYFTEVPFVNGAFGVHTSNARVSGANEQVVMDSARVAVLGGGNMVFVAYVVASAPNVTEIEVASSQDGQSFSTPVVVDDDPGCATHFHPWPFVDDSGTLWVTWVDNRDGNGNVYYSTSSDLGQTFGPSHLVSSAPFNFTTLINGSQAYVPSWLGAYQVLRGSSGELYSLYTANPGGSASSAAASHLFFSKSALP